MSIRQPLLPKTQRPRRSWFWFGCEPGCGESLLTACNWGLPGLARFALRTGANPNGSTTIDFPLQPLFLAAREGHTKVVRLLIEKGADVDAPIPGPSRLTPLFKTVYKGHVATARALLEGGADVNKLTAAGAPLHIAVFKNNPDMISLLLEYGADVTQCEPEQGTPVLAFAADYGYTDVVKTLIDAGAGANQANWRGVTPLMMAAAGNHIDAMKVLLREGAQRELWTDQGGHRIGSSKEEGSHRSCRAAAVIAMIQSSNKYNTLKTADMFVRGGCRFQPRARVHSSSAPISTNS